MSGRVFRMPTARSGPGNQIVGAKHGLNCETLFYAKDGLEMVVRVLDDAGIEAALNDPACVELKTEADIATAKADIKAKTGLLWE